MVNYIGNTRYLPSSMYFQEKQVVVNFVEELWCVIGCMELIGQGVHIAPTHADMEILVCFLPVVCGKCTKE